MASGGYRVAPGSPLLQDRLYVNHGDGKFVRDSVALPPMLTSTSVVRVGDFNGDGKPDLFVGGRLTPRNYPYPTRSYILRNDGGRFTDVTEALAPELVKPGGMITDAEWSDFDGDGHLDLVTAGEWMPIRFFRNSGQRLTEVVGGPTAVVAVRGHHEVTGQHAEADTRMGEHAGRAVVPAAGRPRAGERREALAGERRDRGARRLVAARGGARRWTGSRGRRGGGDRRPPCVMLRRARNLHRPGADRAD
ncbi:MAG: FG-GAP repeat domain-containing protein, partial [Gemmatimonadaceae bacterium]